MKKRIEWIDTYRGILIILVVLNHQSLQHEIINNSLLAVRMPAFFFISGVLLSERYNNLKYFAYRRFRQLIVPYFIFFIANWIFWALLLKSSNQDIITPIKSMFYGCVNTQGGKQNINAAPLWFITTLFVAEIYMFFLKNYLKGTIKILISLIFLAFLGYITSKYLMIRLPWNMEIALTALFFYGIGYLSKRANLLKKIDRYKTSFIILLAIISISIAVSFSLISRPVYDLNNLGSYPILTYISALFGIISLILVAKQINKNTLLEFFGKNTYIILATHLSAMYLLQGIFKRIGIDFNSTINSDLWAIIYLVLSFIIITPIIWIINNYLPNILYRNNNSKYQ